MKVLITFRKCLQYILSINRPVGYRILYCWCKRWKCIFETYKLIISDFTLVLRTLLLFYCWVFQPQLLVNCLGTMLLVGVLSLLGPVWVDHISWRPLPRGTLVFFIVALASARWQVFTYVCTRWGIQVQRTPSGGHQDVMKLQWHL